jgi:hypothetical protein
MSHDYVRREWLEYEHKQVLDTGKFFYDGVFKIAPMSFLINGLLLGASAFFIKDAAGKIVKETLSLGMYLIGAIGIVYNLGAFCACASLLLAAWNLTTRFNTVDRELGLHIGKCRTKWSNGWAYGAVGLSCIFFVLWMTVWCLFIFIVYRADILIVWTDFLWDDAAS